jgi:hypothetical protein
MTRKDDFRGVSAEELFQLYAEARELEEEVDARFIDGLPVSSDTAYELAEKKLNGTEALGVLRDRGVIK